ncbi:citrate lyase beta chain / Citryl-CoA lyase subunit [Candidatus Pelagibacter sp. HTCC7211]|uniref:HpcH/HpaI aldolase/citrate lyase family protein n=1 Tax=Pelagibacter sp. (strain HTCC7211) TaxID=439493 RepID=UPI000183B73B|nr:CoA ester lyase [Candidatus Pelagibacter sp. HTCC7211]EDZ60733.1 citrate lyase beta chain / Citryl-CoA lyase subunit [Candidatus Pelagibacter sp. HTCC7211]MBD1151348.1 CoA ester lyase [Pelagibacterales bacterium SAG-MED25]
MNSNKINVRRSFIFTPGLKPEMFPKAISSGADMVCIELEDGIAIKDKDEARKNTFKALETLEVKSGVELVVRVNCQRTKFGLMDLEAVVSSKTNVKAIMLPKVKTPDEITFIDDMLTDCGLDTDLHVIMETNEALESIYDIAHASKRIVALYFGGVDMAAELRVPNEYKNLIYARSRLVHAGASVGVDVIDVPYLDLEDMDGMKKEAELVRDLGFTGKGSIHPKQINMLNEIFTPSKEEIIKAKRIVDQFNESDTGLVVIDGKLIEKPVLREMQRKILIADKINQS